MPEAVIVSTARSPIGRAVKGSLKDMRPDDLTTQMVNAVLAKTPGLDPADITDLMLGVGQPAGESGNNLARVVSVLAGLDHLPGVTVNRYCSSSLQTTRMAYHAIRAGEGDVYISAGVETVSRYFAGFADAPEARNPLFAEAEARTVRRSGAGSPPAAHRRRARQKTSGAPTPNRARRASVAAMRGARSRNHRARHRSSRARR